MFKYFKIRSLIKESKSFKGFYNSGGHLVHQNGTV